MERSGVPTVTGYELLLADAAGEDLDRLIERSADDPRAGVQRARERAMRRRERLRAEDSRLSSLMDLQRTLHAEGHAVVAGVDEVGRGALAGPVTVAAVILCVDARIDGLDDSKKLPRKTRERLALELTECCVSHAVAHIPAHVIDVIGIVPATKAAMEIALGRLDEVPSHVVTDGHPFGLPYPETAVVRGDSLVASIAAASIIAKVARDRLMGELVRHYPEWSFDINRGYGTPEHLDAIARHGLTPIHRRSFAPCNCSPTLF